MSRIRCISSFSVIVAFIAVALLGCAMLPLLPVRLNTSETLPAINVNFSMQGSSARTIESEATSRLESALARVAGVKHIKSRSRAGSGTVTIELDRNADVGMARFEAAMAVRQIWSSMPENASYPQIAVRQVDDNAAGPFMSYTVNAGQSPAEIMLYAEDYITPVLSRLPGVAKVELSGATPMEWRVEYDNNLMAELGISLSQISSAISAYFGSEFLGLAFPREGDDANWLRVALSSTAADGALELNKIAVAATHGQVITLDKIATAVRTEAAPTGYYRINGLNSVYLNITAADNANQIDLSRKVRYALANMDLPAGYMLDLRYDASERIEEELGKIYFRTGLTVLILLVFVGLITLSLRYLMLITISLAINMAVAFVLYYMLGVEIQLYSLAGITISLNLVIDNLIVMTEHITRRHDLRAFSAVLAATLTTIGALSAIFFLDEKTILSLKDFVIVVIVNLSVSLVVSLLLLPALIDRIGVGRKASAKRARRKIPARMARFYSAVVMFVCRHKAIVCAVFILAFGFPVFLLPEKVEGESKWASLYNSTFGSERYKNDIKPIVDRALGGSLRLFAEKVGNGSYWGRGDNEPMISINATLPNGATLSQMDALMTKMENFLSQEEGIRQFQTSIYSARRGAITVYFKPEYQNSGYPYRLKSDVIAKAQTLGGGSWGVYGLQDQGFNNDVRESAGSYRVKMRGYNYDELSARAEQLRDTLLTHRRIREVIINSEFSYWKDDYTEFYLDIDKERLNRDSLSVSDLFMAIKHDLGRNIVAGSVPTSEGMQQIKISSADRNRDVWGLMNVPVTVGARTVKVSDYATIERRQAPPEVVKEDQEYILCLQYEYIGSATQGSKVIDRVLEQFSKLLPIGYHAEREGNSWRFGSDSSHYWLLGLIAVIIFFISSILFNSLRQPLAIILVIPVSFIGVFVTFYIFDLKFDQGGFASFILLCGITVNAAIYIINEYNALRRRSIGSPDMRLYIKAFRTKITAVMLTVLSTVLGFIPFVIGSSRESFWFPLAAGTMGGLIMSLTAIMILLPIMILPKPKRKPTAKRVGKSCA